MKITEIVSLSLNFDRDNLSCEFMLILLKSVVPTAVWLLSARLISGKPLSAEEEDIDVARERGRVYEGKAQNDLLRIYDLTKVLCSASFGSC